MLPRRWEPPPLSDGGDAGSGGKNRLIKTRTSGGRRRGRGSRFLSLVDLFDQNEGRREKEKEAQCDFGKG